MKDKVRQALEAMRDVTVFDNMTLTRDERDELQAAGYCTYPNCKCITNTSTAKPWPNCPRGLK